MAIAAVTAILTIGGILVELRLPGVLDLLNPKRLIGVNKMAFDAIFMLRGRWPEFPDAAVLVGPMAAFSALAAIATTTVFLPSHPFNYVYNYGVRHVTGTRPLPPSTPQGRFACGVGGVWLAATGAAFFVGATTLGYVLGGVMAAMATLGAAFCALAPLSNAERWRLPGLALLLSCVGAQVVIAFPSTANHHYLEFFCLLMLMLNTRTLLKLI